MPARNVPHNLIALPEDEAIVLSGPPKSLTGRVAFHNPGNTNVVIRGGGLKDPSGLLVSSLSRHALTPFTLRPNQGRSVPLKIALDSTTPPGEYHVELDVADRSRSAVLHVTEVFDMTVRPKSLVVANLAGKGQRKQLVITNGGNVAFTIGDIGDADLIEDQIRDRAVRVAVEPLVNNPNINIEELVIAVLRVARDDAYRAGTLSVRNLSGMVEVMPGEMTILDLEITVNEELPNNNRYRGSIPLLTQDLEILVVSSGSPVENKTLKRPTDRTTKKAATEPKKTPKGKGGKR